MKRWHYWRNICTVIQINIKHLLSNTIYLFGALLLILASVLLLMYQEKTNPVSGEVRKNVIEWSLNQTEPVKALSELREQIISNPYSYTPVFADNLGEELQTLDEVFDYMEDCSEYEAWLLRTIENAQSGISFATQSYEMRLRDLLTLRQYEELKGLRVQGGNYIAWEKFFESGIAEAVMILLILYTVYHVAVIEREKGMNTLIHSLPGGGYTYYFCKLITCAVIVSILFVFVTGSKLGVYLGLYGSSSLSCPLQGLRGFLGSPFSLSVGEYAVLYIIYQYLFNLLIMMLMLALTAFSLSEASICILISAVGAVSVMFNVFIPDYSFWKVFKDISLVSLQDTGYWFSHMHFCYVCSIGKMDFYFQKLQLPVIIFLLLSVASCLAGNYLYGKGLKKSTGKKRLLSRLWNYQGKTLGNELQYLLFQRKNWLVGVIVVLTFAISGDYKAVESDSLRYEKSIRQTLNQMNYDEALEWLAQKKADFKMLHDERDELLDAYIVGDISSENYERACEEIDRQLKLENTVNEFDGQTAYLSEAQRKTGENIPFAYKTLSDNVYGDKSKYERLLCAIMTAFFVILSVLPVMPTDRQLHFSKLIGSTPSAQKVVKTRIYCMMCQVFTVALSIQGIWLYSLGCRYQWLGWNLPVQSWERYSGITIRLSLGEVICISAVFYSFGWALLAGLLEGFTMFSSSAVWMEMLGVFFLLGPLMLDLLDVSWAANLVHMRWMVFGQNDIFLSMMSMGSIILMAVMIYAVVRYGWERWIQ